MAEPRIPFSDRDARDRFERLSSERQERVIEAFFRVLRSTGMSTIDLHNGLFYDLVSHPGRYAGCPFVRHMKFRFTTVIPIGADVSVTEHEVVINMVRPDHHDYCVKSLLEATIEFIEEVDAIRLDVDEIRRTIGEDEYAPISLEGEAAAAAPRVNARTPQPTDTVGTPECVVCMSNRIALVVVPCGHANLCHGCYKELDARGDRNCPSCRTPIQSTTSIFLP